MPAMTEGMYELAKKNITTMSLNSAEEFIYNLARNRRISFSQFQELNKIKRKVEINLRNLKRYLRKEEWKIGNGQCPRCNGRQSNVFAHLKKEEEGHDIKCSFAKILKDIGLRVVYKKENE